MKWSHRDGLEIGATQSSSKVITKILMPGCLKNANAFWRGEEQKATYPVRLRVTGRCQSLASVLESLWRGIFAAKIANYSLGATNIAQDKFICIRIKLSRLVVIIQSTLLLLRD